MSKLGIGLHQARLLCGMTQPERLAFIAEGLPIILASARELWTASRELQRSPRAANILEGHAEEEAAKILILLDIVRCPAKSSGSRTGPMVRWFYDHLARMIYAQATSWKPMSVEQLREYVDSTRKAHFVEGEYGEHILPNWDIYVRESRLYVDIEAQEDGSCNWSVPQGHWPFNQYGASPVMRTTEALSALGVFTSAGIQAVADVWGGIDFVDKQSFSDTRHLVGELLERLNRENLFTAAARDEDFYQVNNFWQMPMYNLDFSLIPVSLEDLQAERDNRSYAEI